MHYISNEAHSILTSVEQAQSPLSPLHSSLPHSYIKSPPVSRARLRPHSSQGSMSAPAIRATTMYINAEMGNGKDPANVNVDRERHASSASYVTGGSSLGSVREEEGDSLAEGAQDVQETSTPAHISKNVARKVSHLSELSIATSNGMLQQATATSNLSAPDVSATMLSPTLSSATANSSTPSSTFFSSFWSRSSAATNASSNLSSHSSPNTTMDTSSPSLSRFLARKSAPPAHNTNTEEDKKDAKGMLSALAASSPPMPSSEPDASSSKPRLEASSSSFIPPTSPTTTTSSITASSSLSQHQGYEARSPPMPSSASTAALAQLSAIHSSPHLTVSSRPRHRASLSESLLRASWSGNNLKSEVAAAVAKGAKEESAKGHKRSRHSTSPAGQFQAQVSNVSVNHKRERSGRDRE